MKEWTGTIKTISDRDFQGTRLWSFTLEESERFFRTGKEQPNVMIGDSVCFQERNSQVDVDTLLHVWTAAAPVKGSPEKESTVETTAPCGVPATSSDVWQQKTDVGERIRYQAARADACRIVVAALHTEHLPHAANIAKGKRLDLLLGYVDQVTETLLKQEEDHGTK